MVAPVFLGLLSLLWNLMAIVTIMMIRIMMHWDFNKQFIIPSLQNSFLACIALKGLPHSLTTNYGVLSWVRTYCGVEISSVLFISKYRSWWLGKCSEIAGSDSPNWDPIWSADLSSCSARHLIASITLPLYWLVAVVYCFSTEDWGAAWYYAMVAVLTRGSDARLACTSS